MSWFAISNGRHQVKPPKILVPETGSLLTTGTILVEFQYTAEEGQRQTVLDLHRQVGWLRKFRLTIDGRGQVVAEHRQGTAITKAALTADQPDRDATLRLTFSWQAPERLGLMTLENIDNGQIFQTVFEEPYPWPLDDVAALLALKDTCVGDPTVTLLACSDELEPVGHYAGFASGTLVDTNYGALPIEALRPGYLVRTSDGDMQPVRHVVRYEMPALGRFSPVRLRAPYFGLKRDLTVAPDHRLLITGVDAEYLFGTDAVLVEARHLAKMAGSHRPWRQNTIHYVQVLLDTHTCLSVAGAWGESLFLGDLARHPARHATSLLAGIPARELPRHTKIVSPQLCSYEAMVLVSALCA